ncbi:MAG: hypothetical protein E6H60_04630 [Betaproteobacteria bacterium]|nr:MAG: hypothetical protein E6H60_04630 [Betaproteobacteria bacterium]
MPAGSRRHTLAAGFPTASARRSRRPRPRRVGRRRRGQSRATGRDRDGRTTRPRPRPLRPPRRSGRYRSQPIGLFCSGLNSSEKHTRRADAVRTSFVCVRLERHPQSDSEAHQPLFLVGPDFDRPIGVGCVERVRQRGLSLESDWRAGKFQHFAPAEPTYGDAEDERSGHRQRRGQPTEPWPRGGSRRGCKELARHRLAEPRVERIAQQRVLAADFGDARGQRGLARKRRRNLARTLP